MWSEGGGEEWGRRERLSEGGGKEKSEEIRKKKYL